MINHIDLMAALTADYLNVYVLRPLEDSADIIKLKGYVVDGITENPKGFNYTSLLTTYANSRVYEGDRECFLTKLSCESLIGTFADMRESFECDYRIVENGEIHHYTARYSRISKPDEDLRLVVAFRNIDSVVNVGIEQRTMGLYNAYSALSNIFYSLHRVNVQKNTFAAIKTTPSIEKTVIPGSDEYDANFERVVRALSSKWSLADALEFVDRSTLESRMAGKNHITTDFLSYASVTCRLHFFREDTDEDGRLCHVIFGVEKLDEEKSFAVINALSREFQNVYYINLDEGSSRILKTSAPVSDELDERTNQIFDYGKTTEKYLVSRIHPDDREMFIKTVSIGNLRRVFREKEEISGSVRIVADGVTHYCRYTYYRLADLNCVIAGFRNIDDIIEQHAREERQKREKELEYQKQREEQLSIFDTLAHNFKNVYLVDIENATARVLKLEDDYTDNRLDNVMDKEFPYEPFLNEWISESVHPDDRKVLAESLSVAHLREVFADGRNEYIGTYRILVNGEPIHYQFSVNLMKDGGHLIAGFQNVDSIIRAHLEEERKRQEKEKAYQDQMKEQLLVFDTLARNFRNVYLADMDRGTMKILKLSDGYDKLLNVGSEREIPFDDIRRLWIETVVCPEDREEVRRVFETENVKNLLLTQGEFTGHYRSIINGKLHHFQYIMSRISQSGLKAVLGYQNVDEIVEEHLREERRKREMEEALLRDEREHSEVISAVSTIYSTIFRADIGSRQYEVLTSVPGMGAVAGKSGNFDDVKEKIISTFMAEEMKASMRQFLDIDTLPRRLEDVNTVATEYRNPSGKWFEARFIVKRRDENGRAVEVLYVARDITVEKMKEFEQQEQLSHALAAAQQANRAKSTFLNSMSHDIRTPMNAIIGFTALAQTHLDNREQVQDYLAKISTSSTHLLSLINDVLDMSRIESGTVKLDEKPLHIPDLLHDLRTMIQSLINAKNLNLFIDTQDVEHEDVIADKLRLNQVLINIVGNAIKYTQPGGDIMIRLVEKPCSMKQYTTYEFSVKDNGIGISKEFLAHIFESFSRERSSTITGIQGTGLGMAITKNIVDMMGGTITAESEEGKGSLFTVTLNLKIATTLVREKSIPALRGARALVVDDDLNTCRSVSKMLREIEMRPDWTSSGKEAVVRAQDATEMKDEYKVYIIDYLMPDMNGIETVRQIRRVISEDVPIIVLTAYDWSDFESEAREAGVTAFVSKPIFMSELRSVLTSREEDDKKESETVSPQRDYSSIHALLVEDNDLNREIATALLESLGMRVDSASDGVEAVDIMYRAAEDEYDLVFMDIQMPKMDGYTATHEIRTLANNRKANIPIIAMTANAFEEDRKKSLEAGMNGHIAKPVSIDEIVKVLDSLFEGEKS